MFAYIKNGNLIATSDSLIERQIEEVSGLETVTTEKEIEVIENGLLTTKTTTEEHQEWIVSQPLTPGLIYDEVIEYTEEGRVTYEGGKIIAYEASEEKAAEDKKAEEEAAAEAKKRKEARPQAIIEELGKLKAEKDGLALVGGDTAETDARIAALQEEYAEITA